MFARWYASHLRRQMAKPYVHLVFGARQTGKSTLLQSVLPPDAVRVDLSVPSERSRLLVNPDELISQCLSLPPRKGGAVVFVDEAQAVPAIFDAVQHLYDRDKQRWRFILCGSSARKLRQTGANLLPGRNFLHRLFPLTLAERPPDKPPAAFAAPAPLPLPWAEEAATEPRFPAADLATRLAYGELPGIVTAPEEDRPQLLHAYTEVHLEEEIRREALVRDWAAFVRFLRLAAAESGQVLNYAAIAGECGLAQPTIKGYYQLLEDMFIGIRVPAWSRSPRKNLLSSPKFLLFDLGVRHAAAGLAASPDVVTANPGPFFEQWVGIELWKRLQYLRAGTLHYLRTRDGAEIDFIVEQPDRLTPFEVKWTERPELGDARHLLTFLDENPRKARHGFIVCRCPRPLQLHEKITALPWSCL